MEYQEPDRLEHGPGGPIFFLQRLHFVSNNNIHHIGLVLQRVLLHEVMGPGIMVCVTLILKTFARMVSLAIATMVSLAI